MNKPLRMPFVDDIAINCPCDDCNFDDGCDKCPSVIAGAKAALERILNELDPEFWLAKDIQQMLKELEQMNNC